MKNIYNLNELKPADRLVIPKSGLNLVQHHVIYLGIDNTGSRFYIENTAGKGVQVISEHYLFRDGYEITRIERFTGNQKQRKAAVKFAMQLIGKPYNLINFNCEHYANTVQNQRSYSMQVGVGIGLSLFVLALIVGLSRSNKYD